MACLLKKTLVDVGISGCKNLDAAASLRALEPIRDRIQRLHIDCGWEQEDAHGFDGIDYGGGIGLNRNGDGGVFFPLSPHAANKPRARHPGHRGQNRRRTLVTAVKRLADREVRRFALLQALAASALPPWSLPVECD